MFSEDQQIAANRRWHLLVNVIAASGLVTQAQRAWVYRIAGLNLDSADIRPGCFFLSTDVEIGPGSMIGPRCYFETPVRIGARCFVAMQTLVGTWTHTPGGSNQRAGDVHVLPTVIEDGCWLGARTLITPGVTVGTGCIIGAGAVVTKDCEPNGLYAGVPATRKKSL